VSFAVGEAVDGVPHVGVGGDDDAVGNCDTESQGGLAKTISAFHTSVFLKTKRKFHMLF